MDTEVNVQYYIDLFTDANSFKESSQSGGVVHDPLQWKFGADYQLKIQHAIDASGFYSGVIWGECTIENESAILIINNLNFMGGSLALAETDEIVNAIQCGIARKLPVIWFAQSGGCRIYEGVYALHCISKIIHARNSLAKVHLPLISVPLNTLYGGTNICASLADIIIAEKGAHLGFAGVNVIQSIERFPLPPDFQSSEYGLSHGHIDEVCTLNEIKTQLAELLKILSPIVKGNSDSDDFNPEKHVLSKDPWHTVQSARSGMIKISTLISNVFEAFFELHGDRINADDSAIISGIGRIGGQSFIVVAHNNSNDKETGFPLAHQLSSVHPSGHRKALRMVRLAERLRLPVITFIDTPGAQMDVKSEAEGQPIIIGELISAMLEVPVTTIGFIIGEGGSAGALPFTTVDNLIMFETAIYSLISPEGVAAIIAQDISKTPDASRALKLTAPEMVQSGIADYILSENSDQKKLAVEIKNYISYCLQKKSEGGPILSRRLRI